MRFLAVPPECRNDTLPGIGLDVGFGQADDGVSALGQPGIAKRVVHLLLWPLGAVPIRPVAFKDQRLFRQQEIGDVLPNLGLCDEWHIKNNQLGLDHLLNLGRLATTTASLATGVSERRKHLRSLLRRELLPEIPLAPRLALVRFGRRIDLANQN
jgi:hypothetical protein